MEEFFPEAIFGAGTFYEFNRIQLVRLVVVLILVGGLMLVASRAKLVPSRGQSMVEAVIGYVRKDIIEDVIGAREAKPYIPMLTTIFFTVFAMNLAGVVPGLNIAGTSVIGIPLLLALWTFVTYMVAGIKKHGVGHFLKNSAMPPGLPKLVYLILTPIELLQLFVIRWASLTVRLLANMFSGHMMLLVFIGITEALIVFSDHWALKGVGVLAFFTTLGFTFFEAFVALLQAFIFTLLSAVYIQMALADEH
ncbi:F0F1 ATP synthase subunit A [Dermabacteraceae bacterium TAE3-ERU5]|nr:F0F1 ATP synthase subunit A [Dermabacteraceae bacterium TAE3-ERU5]